MSSITKQNASQTASLEHVNISVRDPDQTAQLLCGLLGWTIRWSGVAMDDGYTVHVGSEQSYLALYTNSKMVVSERQGHSTENNLNHVAVVVSDLEHYRKKSIELGLTPINFSDYGYCKSFYITDKFGLEIEIVCYV